MKLNVRKLVLAVLAVFFYVAGVVYICINMDKPTRKTVTISAGEKSSTRDIDISFTKNQNKRWFDGGNPLMGAQFDGRILNTTDSDLSRWILKIKVPERSYIDSSWNGIYSIKDGILTVVPAPAGFNRIIKPHEPITFGCIMYADKNYTPDEFSFTYSSYVNVFEMPVFWVLALATFAMIIIGTSAVAVRIKLRITKQKEEFYRELINQTLKTFANTIEAKDLYTKGHSVRVSTYAERLAQKIGLPPDEVRNIYISAILHDVGKILIPDSILNKKGELTESEFSDMKTHAEIGAEILRDFTAVPNISNIVLHHHEKFDGSGYPDGLKGAEIPLESRIICIADCFDAMTTTRCYRKSMPLKDAIAELERCAGHQFDPELIPPFVELIRSGSFRGMSESQ